MNRPKTHFDSKQYYIEMHRKVLDTSNNEYQEFLLEDTEKLVTNKLKFMTKTQMRNIFELIRNCNTADELKMLKPKLIYTAGRLSGEGKFFLLELSKLVIKAKDENDVSSMKKFVETVLAYHKYYAQN